MSKIGFVNLCHEDYIDENVDAMATKAVQALGHKNIDICCASVKASDFRQGRKAGQELASKNLDGVILFLGSWMECTTAMAVIREIEHLPLLLWGFPMFFDGNKVQSTGSYVSFAMFKGSMDRAGYRFTELLGLPDDASTLERATGFCRAAFTKTTLKRIRIGLFGYSSMNIYPGTFDHLLLRTVIGPEVVHFDSYTLIKKAEGISPSHRQQGVDRIRNIGSVCPDVSTESLLKAAGIYEALKELVMDQDLNAVNIKCQYEFSKEYKMVPCVPLSILADDGIVASCEGDMMCTVSMEILSLLTGQTVAYGDAIHHSDNTIKLSSCGMLPFSLGEGKRIVCNFMPHDGFNGIQTSYVMHPGRVTVMRLVEDVGSYHMLYFTGEGQKTALRQGYMPALDIKLDGSMEKLIQNFAGQHFALCYGDCSEEIEQLCNLLGIKFIKI